MCTCKHTCIRIYIHTHINTYTHTYLLHINHLHIYIHMNPPSQQPLSRAVPFPFFSSSANTVPPPALPPALPPPQLFAFHEPFCLASLSLPAMCVCVCVYGVCVCEREREGVCVFGKILGVQARQDKTKLSCLAFASSYVCMYVCIHTYVCVCVCVCVCVQCTGFTHTPDA